MSSVGVSPDDVVGARAVLQEVIRETPVLESSALSALVGGPVLLKCENLQRGGSFKVRGAYVRIARLTPAERERGVVAASAGNHAQGVALAAGALGAKATVVMPAAAPLPKVAATRSYGAEVVLHGASVEDALARAQELAATTGSVFIHPFDHPDVVAGQGTVGVEIAEQCPHARTIAVPVGGGGLAAGVAVAVSGLLPAARLIGVQAEAVAPVRASIAAGHPVTVTPAATMADGIAVARPGDLTVALLAAMAPDIVTVTEENLSRALLLCLERAKQVAEPAGAAGIAALLEHPGLFEPPVVIVLSGGNIDPLLLSKVLRHGLAAAGRFVAFRCKLPDQPGALATLLAELAGLGANVVDVVHERVTPDLRVDEAEVSLHLETRGPEHTDSVVSQLRKAGYTLLFS
ncbi:MAG: threonine ammonia-lyase [Actinobacteria bacterium]|nr:threonine ammonia-lyase [Actinomycetota bacterium]MBO0836692.1 threonine ammonia-lyase [Actinomycetota bacterium]